MNYLLFFAGSFVSLFSICNPLMAVPVFIPLTSDLSAAEKATLARRAALNVLGILLAFFIAGELILGFFGISIDALRIAGGLMIVSSGYNMLNKKDRLNEDEQEEASEKEDIAFSPLAMPLMSGPGAIAVLIGMATDAQTIPDYLIIGAVILLVTLVCYGVLRLSDILMARLGETLMKAFARIMGFILLCVGVQSMVNGIQPVLVNIIDQVR